MPVQRRRRVSRKAKQEEDGDEDNDEQVTEEDVSSAKKTSITIPKSAVHLTTSTEKQSSKRRKTDQTTLVEEEKVVVVTPREWGSKQPKPCDLDILKYTLTTGGELARKVQSSRSAAKAAAVSAVETEVSTEALRATSDDDEEVIYLRNALFKEIEEGEASLSCDKRGSRVLQNLVKEGTTQQVCSIFERLKPYVGCLAYDKCASHVLQALMERCSLPTAPAQESQYVTGFCAEISKANEWWALMHDVSGTYVARTCALGMKALEDEMGLASLFSSIKNATQADLRSAARNPTAGPFLAVAMSVQPDEKKRETLFKRLFSDERNEVELDRKQFDAVTQDRVGSRVMDQVIPFCSKDFVHDVIFNQGFQSPFLQRAAKHPFANFVVQRTIEMLQSHPEALDRVLKECPVQELIDYDKVGVLTSIARVLADVKTEESSIYRDEFVQDLIKAGALERATKAVASRTAAPIGSAVAPVGGGKAANVVVDANVNLALTETLHTVLEKFPAPAKQPLIHELLQWDASKLCNLACDPVGGRKLLETILQGTDADQKFSLAKRFKGSFAKLAIDKFGVHVARKAFVLLRKNDLIAIMNEEIVPNKSKILGYNYGSKFLSQIDANRYSVTTAKEWAKRVEDEQKNTASLEAGGAPTAKASLKRKWETELGL